MKMIAKNSAVKPWMFSKEVFILYHGLQDRRSGILPKLPAVMAVVYLLMPFDLVPDFIPFLGYIDDVLVVPFLLNLSVRFLPGVVFQESQARAAKYQRKFRWITLAMLLAVIALLVGVFFLIKYLFQF